MHLHPVDWAIIVVSIIALRLASLRTRHYMKGVADFLSANRSAGRYLLTIAGQMGGTGVISIVAAFEMHYDAGLPPIWWGFMTLPVGVIILMSGWVFYRFRETRALTLAQFFEMRYNRKFRIYAGILGWTSGILNFGLFPAVAARFFIYFCGLPDHFQIPGIPIDIATFPLVMGVDLAFALTFVNLGGQVSIMVTECLQGIVSSLIFVLVAIAILIVMPWDRMVDAMHLAPVDASMLHPFKTSNVKDFNVWFFLIGLFSSFYNYMAWQGSSGFNSSARTPHEQRMGQIIAVWRELPRAIMTLLLPLAAFAVMKLPEYASTATQVTTTLNGIQNETLQTQMRVPVVLAYILPVGIKGLFAVLMLFYSFTCHDTYIHSWGSIFVQDVWIPLRKKALTPEQHIKLLRRSIIGVAIFSFLFSLLYPQNMKILFFFAITGTIWLGGAGAVIIGGLYWKKGTTAAAFSALTVGSTLGVLGLVVPEIYKNRTGSEFPINGQWLYLIAMLSAIVVYVVVSLLTCRGEGFNLDRMLHRGKYARPGETPPPAHIGGWRGILGINEHFSRGDRALVTGLFVWNGGWFLTFVVVTIINLFSPFADDWWAKFWHAYILVGLAIGIPATVWFTIGGYIDIKALLQLLSSNERDATDDGRVIHHHDDELPSGHGHDSTGDGKLSSLDEIALVEPIGEPQSHMHTVTIQDQHELPAMISPDQPGPVETGLPGSQAADPGDPRTK